MKISEIFSSLQGEIDQGMPVVFIRLSGCNLIREGKACKFCDSLYAEEGKIINEEDILKEVLNYKCNNVVITGGEPMIQKESVFKLTQLLNKEKKSVDIETNGSIFDKRMKVFRKINCSPKKQMIKNEVLSELVKLKNSRFKFVYESSEEKWWEQIIQDNAIPSDKVWIMPEGKTKQEQLERMKEVFEYCQNKRYNMSSRLHVLTFDNRRGV